MERETMPKVKLQLRGLTKKFGELVVLDRMSLDVFDGEFLALVGPSGCGKTTTLRLVAGFLTPDAGEILLDGELVSSPQFVLPPEKRNVTIVFQSYAIWPHKTVFENIAFGLQLKRFSKPAIRDRVRASLELVKLQGLEGRYPGELSGGQQQRVSLARALVVEPKLILLDEPLSNLDATLREEMRFDLRDLQQKMGITSVYVTHDQTEAMVIADRIVVMHRGLIEQIGTAEEIYHHSRTDFVAKFVGYTNMIKGKVHSLSPDGQFADIRTEGGLVLTTDLGPSDTPRPSVGEEVSISVRPEAVSLGPDIDPNLPNRRPAVVLKRIFLGSHCEYRVRVDSLVLRVQTSPLTRFASGDEVFVQVDPKLCVRIRDHGAP